MKSRAGGNNENQYFKVKNKNTTIDNPRISIGIVVEFNRNSTSYYGSVEYRNRNIQQLFNRRFIHIGDFLRYEFYDCKANPHRQKSRNPHK